MQPVEFAKPIERPKKIKPKKGGGEGAIPNAGMLPKNQT